MRTICLLIFIAITLCFSPRMVAKGIHEKKEDVDKNTVPSEKSPQEIIQNLKLEIQKNPQLDISEYFNQLNYVNFVTGTGHRQEFNSASNPNPISEVSSSYDFCPRSQYQKLAPKYNFDNHTIEFKEKSDIEVQLETQILKLANEPVGYGRFTLQDFRTTNRPLNEKEKKIKEIIDQFEKLNPNVYKSLIEKNKRRVSFEYERAWLNKSEKCISLTDIRFERKNRPFSRQLNLVKTDFYNTNPKIIPLISVEL